MTRIPMFSITVHLALLFLCGPIYIHSQKLIGSFGPTARFYEKCRPFSEEIRHESFEVAWRGERISRAIVIWTEQDSLEDISFYISAFTDSDGTPLDGKPHLRSVNYVKADPESKPCGGHADRDPGHFRYLGDVLGSVPDTSIHPGCPSVYWLTLDIPASSEPGLYNGSVSVLLSGQPALEFKLKIEVTANTLPPVEKWTFHLDLWQFPAAMVDRYNGEHPDQKMAYWSEDHYDLLRKNYRLLASMGQKVITAHIKEGALGSPSMVRWIMHADSTWEYDFEPFKQYVDSMMSWGIDKQISCQSPVGWNSDLIPYWCESTRTMKVFSAPIGTGIYANRWNHFLDALKECLDEKGWFEKAVLYLDEVEPEKLDWLIEFIKAHDPDWKIGFAGFHTPSDFVDSNVFDLSLMVGYEGNPNRRARHGRTTFYMSCNPPRPNNFVAGDTDPAANIWIGWHARHLGLQGFLRWAFDYWKVPDPFDQRIGEYTSGDFSLSYRSSNNLDMEFYPSVRLELLREGIEDFEKIAILEKQLKDPGIPEDLEKHRRLVGKIDEFSHSSGKTGELYRLVDGARELLNDISSNPK